MTDTTPLIDHAADDTEDTPDARELSRAVIAVELEDGTAFEVPVDNRDYVRWDLTAQRQKWPAGQEVPFLFQTFLGWSAARRAGKFTGTFDVFQDVCVSAAMREDDPARPTRPGPGPA